jgi:hypothetical protein
VSFWELLFWLDFGALSEGVRDYVDERMREREREKERERERQRERQRQRQRQKERESARGPMALEHVNPEP